MITHSLLHLLRASQAIIPAKSQSSAHKHEAEPFSPHYDNLQLEVSEIDIFLSQQRSQAGSHPEMSQCFRKAASSFPSQCETVGMNNEHGIAGAIALTLCDLSAFEHYSPPMECITETMSLSRCVDQSPFSALARSPQYWTTYTAHLQSIRSSCYTLRQDLDIDVARSIYRNTTLEHITFFQSLDHHQQSFVQNSEAVFSHYTERIEHLLQGNAEVSDSLSKISMDLPGKFREVTDMMVLRLTTDIAGRQDMLIAKVAEELEDRLSQAFRMTAMDIQDAAISLIELQKGHALESRKQLHAMVHEMTLTHEKSMHKITSFNQNVSLEHLEHVSTAFEAEKQVMFNIAEHVHERWRQLENGVDHVNQRVAETSVVASQTRVLLDDSIKQADRLQRDAAVAVELLGQLAHSTNIEIDKLSDSIGDLRTDIQKKDWAYWVTSVARAFVVGYTPIDSFGFDVALSMAPSFFRPFLMTFIAILRWSLLLLIATTSAFGCYSLLARCRFNPHFSHSSPGPTEIRLPSTFLLPKSESPRLTNAGLSSLQCSTLFASSLPEVYSPLQYPPPSPTVINEYYSLNASSPTFNGPRCALIPRHIRSLSRLAPRTSRIPDYLVNSSSEPL